MQSTSKFFKMTFARVYPLYVAEVERKGRTFEEPDEVIRWLTGFDEPTPRRHIDDGTTFPDFFTDASLNPNASMSSRRARRWTRSCAANALIRR